MQQQCLKRKAIELGHLEAWFCRGRGAFHFENFEPPRYALNFFLTLTRLRSLGERNCLEHVVRHVMFHCPGLPEAFDGFRLLQLSDIHSDGLPELPSAICRKIQGLGADVCVLTGDYRFKVSGPCHNVTHAMQEIVGAVRVRHGILGILGNHDFYEEAVALEGMGVHMLINQSTEISRGGESIWIAGVDDPHYYGCDDLDASLEGIPPGAFKVLLVHSPELYREAQERGVHMYICGHTHAGQLCLPLVGPLLLNARCPRRFCAGSWTYKGMAGYTSAGTGSSMVPARFFCPPEVTVIELKRAESNKTQ
jgi:uncharacterized protein